MDVLVAEVMARVPLADVIRDVLSWLAPEGERGVRYGTRDPGLASGVALLHLAGFVEVHHDRLRLTSSARERLRGTPDHVH